MAEFSNSAEATLTAIPAVTDFVVDRQIGGMSDLEWQFSMVFADQQFYDAYSAHPDHVAFVRDRWQSEVVAFQEFNFVPR